MDQMLFKKFLSLALAVILFDRVESSRAILLKGIMRNSMWHYLEFGPEVHIFFSSGLPGFIQGTGIGVFPHFLKDPP